MANHKLLGPPSAEVLSMWIPSKPGAEEMIRYCSILQNSTITQVMHKYVAVFTTGFCEALLGGHWTILGMKILHILKR